MLMYMHEHMGEINMHTKYWLQNLSRRTPFEDSVTERRVILKMDIKVIGFQEVDWIHLTQK